MRMTPFGSLTNGRIKNIRFRTELVRRIGTEALNNSESRAREQADWGFCPVSQMMVNSRRDKAITQRVIGAIVIQAECRLT